MLFGPIKSSVAVDGQLYGIVIVTCTGEPGLTGPPEGLKPIADGSLLLAYQFRDVLLLNLTVHVQTLPLFVQLLELKLVLSADNIAVVLHVQETLA